MADGNGDAAAIRFGRVSLHWEKKRRKGRGRSSRPARAVRLALLHGDGRSHHNNNVRHPGVYRVLRTLGAVYGLSVRSRNIAASLGMVIKSFAGGELRWFTTMLYDCRNDALGRVVAECKQRGGNAIICLRFDASDLGGFAQTCAYGTACVVEKIQEDEAVAPQLGGQ
ncbi:UPF0145 protein [Colletotrichum orbiculare MAFF 240422]|uniref:UPF0145 protein n=1 Tax=Colletotrichum orbiculare (strain 104-T / ATCC 96160 / CBS 514.97 / LARS 414 / MAFF 240422) TaxID=1213857 RepID=A0A484G8Y0_COLOR|nr:UPF0145 protein [Colletotrichum orbiculare MAFF 240422]